MSDGTFRLIPTYVEDDQLVIFISAIGIEYIHSGSEEFVAQCLEALGISTTPLKFSVKMYRSQFASEYPQDEKWEDRWPPLWKLSVKLNTRSIPGKLPHFVDIDFVDESASDFDEFGNLLSDVEVLLLVCAKSNSKAKNSIKLAFSSFSKTIKYYEYNSSELFAETVVTLDFFRKNLVDIETAIRVLNHAGFETHFQKS